MNRHDRRKHRAVTKGTSPPMSRRERRETNRLLLVYGGLAAAFIITVFALIADRIATDLTVFVPSGERTPAAEHWIGDLRDAGFHVHVKEESDFGRRRERLHIPPEFAAEICAVTLNPSRYVLSGYVPVTAVVRMLREHPQFQGLLLPDLPPAPGKAAVPDQQERDIWGFWSDGSKELFMHMQAQRSGVEAPRRLVHSQATEAASARGSGNPFGAPGRPRTPN